LRAGATVRAKPLLVGALLFHLLLGVLRRDLEVLLMRYLRKAGEEVSELNWDEAATATAATSSA
jgi:hypothetical protein